jgi:hypothetical protein
MTRTRSAAAIGFAVAALALAGCGGDDESASDTTTTDTTATETTTGGAVETGAVLKGSVGPGFDISLTTEDGAAVTSLAPGSYTLLTDDKADIHNFHLTGEGVDVDTGISTEGTNSFDIDVVSGTYTFVCDAHSSMNGSFDVTG